MKKIYKVVSGKKFNRKRGVNDESRRISVSEMYKKY